MSIRQIMDMGEGIHRVCCDPVTMAVVAIGGQVLGGIAQSNAIKADTAAQTAQLQAQADADRFNANVARENANIVEGQTKAELDKADRERRIRMGAARAAGGASGVGIDSFGDILQSSAAQEELDLLTIKSEGLLKKRSFEQTAGLNEASSQNRLNQIPLVKSAGRSRSGSAILSGISSGASTGYSMGLGGAK